MNRSNKITCHIKLLFFYPKCSSNSFSFLKFLKINFNVLEWEKYFPPAMSRPNPMCSNDPRSIRYRLYRYSTLFLDTQRSISIKRRPFKHVVHYNCMDDFLSAIVTNLASKLVLSRPVIRRKHAVNMARVLEPIGILNNFEILDYWLSSEHRHPVVTPRSACDIRASGSNVGLFQFFSIAPLGLAY